MDQKQSRVTAQMNWEQLIFLVKYFSTKQRTGVGGHKKQTRAQFCFTWTVTEVLCTGTFYIGGQIGCPLKTHGL